MSPGAFSPKVKMAVVDRQDGCCCSCGRMVVNTLDYTPLRPAEYHHRLPRRSGGRRGPMAALVATAANCLLLCAGCHDRIERRGRAVAESFGYLLKEGQDPAEVSVVVYGYGRVRLAADGGYVPVGEQVSP